MESFQILDRTAVEVPVHLRPFQEFTPFNHPLECRSIHEEVMLTLLFVGPSRPGGMGNGSPKPGQIPEDLPAKAGFSRPGRSRHHNDRRNALTAGRVDGRSLPQGSAGSDVAASYRWHKVSD